MAITRRASIGPARGQSSDRRVDWSLIWTVCSLKDRQLMIQRLTSGGVADLAKSGDFIPISDHHRSDLSRVPSTERPLRVRTPTPSPTDPNHSHHLSCAHRTTPACLPPQLPQRLAKSRTLAYGTCRRLAIADRWLIALVLFLIAVLGDFVDGYVARWCDQGVLATQRDCAAGSGSGSGSCSARLSGCQSHGSANCSTCFATLSSAAPYALFGPSPCQASGLSVR